MCILRDEIIIVRSEMARPTAPKSIEECQNSSDSIELPDGAMYVHNETGSLTEQYLTQEMRQW